MLPCAVGANNWPAPVGRRKISGSGAARRRAAALASFLIRATRHGDKLGRQLETIPRAPRRLVSLIARRCDRLQSALATARSSKTINALARVPHQAGKHWPERVCVAIWQQTRLTNVALLDTDYVLWCGRGNRQWALVVVAARPPADRLQLNRSAERWPAAAGHSA